MLSVLPPPPLPRAAKLLLENGADASMKWQAELASVYTRGQQVVSGPMSVGGDIDYRQLKLMPNFQGSLFCFTQVAFLGGRY